MTTDNAAASQSEKKWTVLGLLDWTKDYFTGKGIETARLDAEILLAHALDVERLQLYVQFEKPVSPEERTRFRELVQRRADERIPVAYLLGEKEFWSLALTVTPDVLVPRPDTEVLVEAMLARLPEVEAEVRILDIGTGSGAIALSLASERPKARVVATDISAAALAVAAGNAERHGLSDRVHFLEGDGFEPVAGERFDMVVSNPPYVSNADAAKLAPELAHEPAGALFAEAAGTAMLRRIAAEAADALESNGWLGVELSPEQAAPMREWLTKAGFEEIEAHRDLGSRVRALSARRSAMEED
jgi:release factor glutamine methyltransferase